MGSFFGDEYIMKKQNIQKLVMVALFCALSYICVFVFRIKVSFLTFDAKDAIITVCGFLYGPLSAFATALVTSVLEFATVSDTGVYGLIMNLLSSVAFSVPAAFIYKSRKSANSAFLGLGTGIISMTATMLLANLLITPFYMNVDVGVVKALLPSLILPFNSTKALLNSGLVLFIYKPLVHALRRLGLVAKTSQSEYKLNKKTIIVLCVSVVIIIVALVIFSFFLEGSISWS